MQDAKLPEHRSAGWPYEPIAPGVETAEAAPRACLLTASERRTRADRLRAGFVPRIVRVDEIADGCVYWFERTRGNLDHVVDFVLVESECCAFLDFGIGFSAGGEWISLRVSSREGPGNFLTRARAALRSREGAEPSAGGAPCRPSSRSPKSRSGPA